MNAKPSPWLVLLLAAFGVIPPAVAAQEDLTASIAAGGLVPRHDARVSIQKEVVHISDRKIVVDYDLRNDGPADVTTDLAFAVPPYRDPWDAMDPAKQAFRSLKLWADDKPIQYKSEATADLDGQDITRTLEKAHIDVATFGHLEIGRSQHKSTGPTLVADYERLSKKEKHRLTSEGIFKGAEGYCLYTVHLTYHWQQFVPARETVHTRQEYVPVVGFTQTMPRGDALQAALLPAASQITKAPVGAGNPLGGFCADTTFVQKMMQAQKTFSESWGASTAPHWVDYALTTDLGWHKPIEDFTLIVDIPQTQRGLQTLISFCSPGVIDKHDSDHIEVHLTKYVPAADLHIGFFNAPWDEQAGPVAAR